MHKAGSIILALAMAVGPAGGATAQDASAPQFKMVRAPKPGEVAKIDVQVDPDEYFAYLNPPPRPDPEAVAAEPDPDGAAPDLPYPAFWAAYGTQGQPRSIERIGELLRLEELPEPRLQGLQTIADRYGKEILINSIDTKVSPAFALAVIAVESGGRPEVTSSAGAQGLMQLIPATAERFGVKDAKDPVQNIRGGIAYLDWLMQEFDGNPVHVLAAYNAGENAVRKYGGAPPYAETRAYVPKVLAAWNVARGLCLTPPDLVSDPCAFKTGKGQVGDG